MHVIASCIYYNTLNLGFILVFKFVTMTMTSLLLGVVTLAVLHSLISPNNTA